MKKHMRKVDAIKFCKGLATVRIKYVYEPCDKNKVILEIHPGAGVRIKTGEACRFVRICVDWKHGYRVGKQWIIKMGMKQD